MSLGTRHFNLAGKVTENQFLHFDFMAGIINVDPDKSTFGIIIKNDTRRDITQSVLCRPCRVVAPQGYALFHRGSDTSQGAQ